MVIVIPNAARQVDFVVLTSINYGLARVGGPVVNFLPSMDVSGVESICICGHGGIGTIEHLPASTFANLLADPARGCKATLRNLILTCCYAGQRVQDKVGTAVIDIMASTLQIEGMRIEGAMGPSIKSNKLGDAYRVVNDTATSKSGRDGSDVQTENLQAEGSARLANLATGGNRKMSWDKIQGKANTFKDGVPYIEYKAKKYEDLSANFFKRFVDDLEDDGLLVDGGNSMRTVYWDSGKVVTVGDRSNGCYITTATVRAMGLPDDCAELQLLRQFRDQVLLPTRSGREDVDRYYAMAPAIVAAIDRLPDADAVYRDLYVTAIAPAARAVSLGRNAEAYALYSALVARTQGRLR